MKLTSTAQIEQIEMVNVRADIFLAASGYEARAIYALGHIRPELIPAKVAFGFTDRITPERQDNDRAFDRAGVLVVATSGDSGDTVLEVVQDLLGKCQGDEIQMLIDYSSMTRTWYAAIIKAILSVEDKKRIASYFIYTPAQFGEPQEIAPNASVGPIPGFCGLDIPDLPSALVIGLGYEKERALALVEYVDPAVCFAFYTDPALDQRYRDVVLRNNADLLSALPKDRICSHPLADMQWTGNLLLSLYSALRDDYRVILAPLGVKPFSLLCLLLTARYGDVDVWRVTAGTKTAPQERKPIGPLLILKAVFERNTSRSGET